MVERELTPRQQAKRAVIREAARSLFLKQGFGNTSTDTITAEAGVSKQTLYVYYPGKEELLADVLKEMVADLPQLEQDLPAHAPLGSIQELRERLLELAERLLTIMLQPDYLALVRIIIAETPRFPYLSDLFRTTVPQQGLKIILAILEQAQQQGLIELVDKEVAARMFLGTLLTYAILDGLFIGDAPPYKPEPERIVALVELYLKALSLQTGIRGKS